MSNAPLSNILLPAVIVSSAVFSTLTLPFALIKSEPVMVEIPPFYSGEIQPIFDGEHKEVAIPYIGFAIVVSVGAGLAVVEVNRRWQAYRESASDQEQSPNLQNSLEKEIPNEALKQPEYRPEVSAIAFATSHEGFRSSGHSEPNSSSEVSEIAIDATQFTETHAVQTPTLVADLEQLNFSPILRRDNLVQFEADRVSSGSTVQNLDFAYNILESSQQYQKSRIKVPHLNRRLLAIEVNGEYYSFLRAENTREKVLEVMAKLGHGFKKTVITKTEKGYIIWAWEPEVSAQVS